MSTQPVAMLTLGNRRLVLDMVAKREAEQRQTLFMDILDALIADDMETVLRLAAPVLATAVYQRTGPPDPARYQPRLCSERHRSGHQVPATHYWLHYDADGVAATRLRGPTGPPAHPHHLCGKHAMELRRFGALQLHPGERVELYCFPEKAATESGGEYGGVHANTPCAVLRHIYTPDLS